MYFSRITARTSYLDNETKVKVKCGLYKKVNEVVCFINHEIQMLFMQFNKYIQWKLVAIAASDWHGIFSQQV